MRHHVGGTHKDGFGHGHQHGPMLVVDLHTQLERHALRKRHKKITRLQQGLSRERRKFPVEPLVIKKTPVLARKEKRSFKDKVKGFVGRLFGRKTG